MRMVSAVWPALLTALPLSGAVQGPPKEPYKDRPDDKARKHVETVGRSPHAYKIEFRGTVDGVMTQMPIGYAAFRQGWQPNRSVRIENVGQSDVRNPRILVNGRRSWRTLKDVVAEATRGHSTPADRARALWEYHRRQRFHALQRVHVVGDEGCAAVGRRFPTRRDGDGVAALGVVDLLFLSLPSAPRDEA